MEEKQKTTKKLQWHPPFYAGIQIEFGKEASELIFENEHQLGTRPKSIDVLVIKKNKDTPIHKNIGRIFKKYNIIEFKGLGDYLSIDDFYKVCGYACFYKADVNTVDNIPIEDITITFICKGLPKKLMKHLKDHHIYELSKIEDGIYEIKGGLFKMQLIWTNGLSFSENLWLKSLNTPKLNTEQAKNLVTEYGKHKNENLYKSVMDIIVDKNQDKFMEVKHMCKALEEIMKDELEEMRARGLATGEKRFRELTRILLEANRQDLLLKAISDETVRKQLYQKYNLA